MIDTINSSGYIVVNRHTRYTQRSIRIRSDFFNEEAIIKIDDNKICFRKPTIDYGGKRHKLSLNKKSGYYEVTVVCELPLGKFQFDTEESDEDCMVVYYR